jgi:hypothetical protein
MIRKGFEGKHVQNGDHSHFGPVLWQGRSEWEILRMRKRLPGRRERQMSTCETGA